MTKPTTIGLKQRIQSASSTAELRSLIEEGATYKAASDGTRRSWRREADKRTKQLATKK